MSAIAIDLQDLYATPAPQRAGTRRPGLHLRLVTDAEPRRAQPLRITRRGRLAVTSTVTLIIALVRGGQTLDENLSEYLSERLNRDYQQLSRLFSSVEGKSIERYFILQKIERAKELIVYGEQSLSEIAYELEYSSQQHFSRLFKKETGLSPTHFKEIKENRRTPIDRL